MPTGRRSSRRWALALSFFSAFVAFVMSTNPEEIGSNFSKWLYWVWPDATLPHWIISPSIDTTGTWITGTLALLSFVWFLAQYIPLYNWTRGWPFTFAPQSSPTPFPTKASATPARRKRNIICRPGVRVRLVCRRAWRVVRLYLPWDYELPYQICAINAHEYWNSENDRVAFAYRFADAFPGCGEIATFSQPRHIIQRLNVLLRWPVVAQKADQQTGEEIRANPFYWIDGYGSMHVRRYYQYKRDIVLLNEFEIIPSYLAAIKGRSHWKHFVYLEGQAMRKKRVPGEMISRNQQYQEFAIYNGRIISRGEYDDGSFLVRDRPRSFEHKPDLRRRNLVRRGLLLIPGSSTANNSEYDAVIERLISQVINDKAKINDLAQFLFSLPKH